MQRWTYRDTHSHPHGYNCKCLSGSSYRTRPHPPGRCTQYVHMVKHTHILEHTDTNNRKVNQAKSCWGKLGEVFLRGWVVFNNLEEEEVMRYQDKGMWVNLWSRGDQIRSMTDRQNASAMSWQVQGGVTWASVFLVMADVMHVNSKLPSKNGISITLMLMFYTEKSTNID